MLFERYVCHRPLNRVARWLGQQGLPMAAGTLGNSVSRFVPLFESLGQAILDHQHQAAIRHGDETSWRIQSLGGPLRPRLAVDLGQCGVLPQSLAQRRGGGQAIRRDRSRYRSGLAIQEARARGYVVLEISTAPPGRWNWRSGARHGDMIYRLNKKRLSHYGLEQQDEAFEAAQRALESGIERLFATATQQLSARHKTAREAKPLRSLLNHRV